MQRTYIKNINAQLVKQTVLVKGWVKKIRKLGSLIFVDVADNTSRVQVVFDENNSSPDQFQLLNTLTRESVVSVQGQVALRKSPNPNLDTGEVELVNPHLEIYSIAKTTPLIIENDTDALEDVRMEYRYLDLRRPNIHNNLVFRSKVAQAFRSWLDAHDFVEVETPILAKPTPEGARDYLVPSRVNKGSFYALPQSPQIFKQLLMVAGMDRYFQIVKCFRDEDLRSDRQPEFTQVDLEMSFMSETEIQDLVEQLLTYVFKKTLNIDLKTPFMRMPYDVAMDKYGVDKPDLRFGLELENVTDAFAHSNFKIFANAIHNHQVVKAIFVNDHLLTKPDITSLEKYAKDMKAKGLAWVHVEQGNLTNGSISKVIEPEIIASLAKQHHMVNGTILFVADSLEVANNSLGIVRNQLGTLLNLKDGKDFRFLWIVDWPLFEYDADTNSYHAAHHPFTSPSQATLATFDTDKQHARAIAYDIVLNGVELGGGSIRITNPDVQQRMFSAIGMTSTEAYNKFGYLLDAFTYGVPPHGGLAFGLDRLVSLMLDLPNIKEVIAFPKNASAVDPMLKAPSNVDQASLNELAISILKDNK